MASSSSLDYWRKLFRSTSSDIFEVLENAIGVAAADRPEEFLVRRDRIAQRLFTCRLDRCLGCDRIQQPPPGDPEAEEDDGGGSSGGGLGGGDGDPNSNYSYDEAEALTQVIEEETQTVGEVLRIKRILDHHQDESDSALFDSLRRLLLMALSFETLKATGIGRTVNRLRKHNHKDIRELAKALVHDWKLLVEEWAIAAHDIPNNSPDSVTPSCLDEEVGLPSPPLDEVALFATQTTSIPLSEFFDGMDDDGNLRNEGDKKRENGRSLENQKPVRKPQQQQYHSHSTVPEYKEHKRQEPAVRQLKPKLSEGPSGQSKTQGIIKTELCNTGSGHERPGRLGSEQKGRSNLNSGVQKKNIASPHDKIMLSEDASVKAKVEVSKRNLQERYQQAENAKKQRTIQVMELHDLPKQGHHQNSRLPSNVKHRSNIRNWASTSR